MGKNFQTVEVEFRWQLQKDDVDSYVDSIYMHLGSYMGSWQSENTIRTELGRIKVTLRHLFSADSTKDKTINLNQLSWEDWLQAFQRLGERSTISYGYRVAKFLVLHDPRLIIPLKNAIKSHLANLRGEPQPKFQIIHKPLFPEHSGSKITGKQKIPKKKESPTGTERKILALDNLLQSLTESIEEDNIDFSLDD